MSQSMKDGEGRFEGRGGLSLYERWWVPEGAPKAWVVVVHGLAEHVGRYAHVAAALTKAGYAVQGLDHRGHGKSAGTRSHLEHFSEYLDDLDTLLERVRAKAEGKPVFLLGHSMGGTIVAMCALTRDPAVQGIVLSGPGLKVGADISPLLIKVGRVISRFLPKAPVQKLDSSAVSRDPAVVQAYETDPLVYHGPVRARLGAELIDVIDRIQRSMEDFRFPFLVMHGTADRLTAPEGSQALYDRARSDDKTIRLLDGLYHEIFNEPEQEKVIAEMVAWLDARVARS